MPSEFARTAGVGVISAALAAWAGSHVWVADALRDADPTGQVANAGKVPLAAALGLVALAAWGVLLATRGAARRVFAVIALAAGLGVLAAVGYALTSLPDVVAERILATQTGDVVGVGFTPWLWITALAAIASTAGAAIAVKRSPSWPAMGSRYDAPGATLAPGKLAEDATNLDWWKSIDEGHDPTEGSAP